MVAARTRRRPQREEFRSDHRRTRQSQISCASQSGINYELSYYYGAAVPDLTNPKCAYLLATPRELDAMTPEYRARLKLLAKSNLIGGGGPPALFEISPEAAK